MLTVYRQVHDLVALLFGISCVWLSSSFLINAFIRLVAPEWMHDIIVWQRISFFLCVLFLFGGTDAIIRAHNGKVPNVRRLMRCWEKRI